MSQNKFKDATKIDPTPKVVAFVGAWSLVKKSGSFTSPIDPIRLKMAPINISIDTIISNI